MTTDLPRGSKPAGRDWGSIREWMNVLAAVGAFLVGVVSLWATAQISGLEDYFRSEISRRNSDLNTLSAQSRRLNTLADERSNELAKLQTTTEAITASNLAAQGRLIATEQELSRVGFEVADARQQMAAAQSRLTVLSRQSNEQAGQLDLFRRKRLFETANLRVLFEGIRADQRDKPYGGENIYNYIVDWPAGEVDEELASYLPEFTTNARSTCQWIRGYSPKIPPQQSYPEAPTMPGKPTADGRSKTMTEAEYKQWQADQEAWSKRWAEVTAANTRASEASERAREYLQKAAANCICRALVTAAHSANAICPGYQDAPLLAPTT